MRNMRIRFSTCFFSMFCYFVFFSKGSGALWLQVPGLRSSGLVPGRDVGQQHERQMALPRCWYYKLRLKVESRSSRMVTDGGSLHPDFTLSLGGMPSVGSCLAFTWIPYHDLSIFSHQFWFLPWFACPKFHGNEALEDSSKCILSLLGILLEPLCMSLRISASLFGVPPPACPGHPPSGRRALDKDAMGVTTWEGL